MTANEKTSKDVTILLTDADCATFFKNPFGEAFYEDFAKQNMTCISLESYTILLLLGWSYAEWDELFTEENGASTKFLYDEHEIKITKQSSDGLHFEPTVKLTIEYDWAFGSELSAKICTLHRSDFEVLLNHFEILITNEDEENGYKDKENKDMKVQDLFASGLDSVASNVASNVASVKTNETNTTNTIKTEKLFKRTKHKNKIIVQAPIGFDAGLVIQTTTANIPTLLGDSTLDNKKITLPTNTIFLDDYVEDIKTIIEPLDFITVVGAPSSTKELVKWLMKLC